MLVSLSSSFYEDMRALGFPLSSWSMDFPGRRAVKRKSVDQLVENRIVGRSHCSTFAPGIHLLKTGNPTPN